MSVPRFIWTALRVLLSSQKRPEPHPWTPEKVKRAAGNAIRERENRGMLS